MFSRHPWKVIVGWISAVSTDKNSCGWCCWHAGQFPVHCRMSRRDSWRKSRIRWCVHSPIVMVFVSIFANCCLDPSHMNWVLINCRSSASADSTSSNPRLFRCTQPIWERQTVDRRLGRGGKVGCRRHRSELRHQVKRQWRWHLTMIWGIQDEEERSQDWSLWHSVFQLNLCVPRL